MPNIISFTNSIHMYRYKIEKRKRELSFTKLKPVQNESNVEILFFYFSIKVILTAIARVMRRYSDPR